MPKTRQIKEQQQQTEIEDSPLTPSQRQAEAIKQTSASAVLATCLSKTYGKVIKSDGFKTYVDDILTASGQPTDPIENYENKPN
jgi:hypothetical protein